jgi:hypothetical protein
MQQNRRRRNGISRAVRHRMKNVLMPFIYAEGVGGSCDLGGGAVVTVHKWSMCRRVRYDTE